MQAISYSALGPQIPLREATCAGMEAASGKMSTVSANEPNSHPSAPLPQPQDTVINLERQRCVCVWGGAASKPNYSDWEGKVEWKEVKHLSL